MIRQLRRWSLLEARDKRLLGAVLLVHLTVVMGLRLVSFSRLLRFLRAVSSSDSAAPGEERAADARADGEQETMRRILWAISVINRQPCFSSSCLAQVLTAQVLLRRHNIHVGLRFGVLLNAHDCLRAHAWLEYRSVIVVGAQTRSEFAPLGHPIFL